MLLLCLALGTKTILNPDAPLVSRERERKPWMDRRRHTVRPGMVHGIYLGFPNSTHFAQHFPFLMDHSSFSLFGGPSSSDKLRTSTRKISLLPQYYVPHFLHCEKYSTYAFDSWILHVAFYPKEKEHCRLLLSAHFLYRRIVYSMYCTVGYKR
jgi:hypothetical protein